MSVQSLNGDSYQGAQVGANVQSQVGTQPMCRQVNALESRSRQLDWHFRFCPDRKRQRDVETKPYQQPNQNKDNHCRGESCPHFVNAFGSGLSVIRGRQERSEHRVRWLRQVGPGCSLLTKGKGRSSVCRLAFQVSFWFVGFSALDICPIWRSLMTRHVPKYLRFSC